MLTGGLVGAFRETTDKLFKHQAHFIVGNRFRAQIGGGEFLHHFKQQVGIFQQADKLAEFEVFEDLTGIRGERLYVAFQVGFDVVLPHLAKIHLRGVEEGKLAGAQQKLLFGIFRQCAGF